MRRFPIRAPHEVGDCLSRLYKARTAHFASFPKLSLSASHSHARLSFPHEEKARHAEYHHDANTSYIRHFMSPAIVQAIIYFSLISFSINFARTMRRCLSHRYRPDAKYLLLSLPYNYNTAATRFTHSKRVECHLSRTSALVMIRRHKE